MNYIMIHLKSSIKERLQKTTERPTLHESGIVRMRHSLQNIVSEIRQLGNTFSKIDEMRQSDAIPRSGIP